MFAAGLPDEGLVARLPQTMPLANPQSSAASAAAGSDTAHPCQSSLGLRVSSVPLLSEKKAKRKLIWLESTKPDIIPSIPMTGLNKVMISKNPPWNRKILCINLPIDLLVNFVIEKGQNNNENEGGKEIDYDSWIIRSETAKYSDFPSLVLADGLPITLGRSHTMRLEPNATIFFRAPHVATDYAEYGFRFIFEDAPATDRGGYRVTSGVQVRSAQQCRHLKEMPHAKRTHLCASGPSGTNPTAMLMAQPAASSSSSSSAATAVPAKSPGGSEPSTAPTESTRPEGNAAPAGVDPEWLQAVMAAFENEDARAEAKRRRLLADGDVVDLVDLDDDDDSPPAASAKHQPFDDADDEETTYEDLQCAICQLYMYNPISLWDCLHPYCSSCMSRWLKNHADCPQCRAPVISVRPNLSLGSLIDTLYKKKKITDPRSEEEKKDADEADTLKTHRYDISRIRGQ